MANIDQLHTTGLFKDELPFPSVLKPRKTAGCPGPQLVLHLRKANVHLHSLLPPTTVWTYEGTYPGPSIETESNRPVTIEWSNKIEGTVPVISVHAAPQDPPAQNEPGLSGATPDVNVTNLHAWTVTHLHGGRTEPDSDGWTENVIGSRDALGDISPATNQARISHYGNSQRATMLWYHDHAFGATRFSVYAGLAGCWFIRDAEDKAVLSALKKTRPRHFDDPTPLEMPLLIQDRNLNVDGTGNLTGELLHKVEDNDAVNPGPMEFFGPLTLVNGKIWPHAPVRPLPYRLRVLNGSNARTYRLTLVDENLQPVNHLICQIGTDGGLLSNQVDLPPAGLVLAPAERADLIVDFSALQPGQRLRWINTAQAPFGNQVPGAVGTPSLPDLLPYPEVMEFRIGASVTGAKPLALPNQLSPTFVRTHHAQISHQHQHRLIALVEGDVNGKSMLTLQELIRENPQPPVNSPVGPNPLRVRLEYDIESNTFTDTYYRVAARLFHDTINWKVVFGATEVWKFINLSEDTHPMHVHLVQFQILDLEENGRLQFDTSVLGANADAMVPHVLVPNPPLVVDDNEKGWKDTIRVNPGEMVSITATFDEYCGRYMYHCHVLEHEDMEMMRPFIVLPEELHALMRTM